MTEAETNPPEHYMGFQVTEAETERAAIVAYLHNLAGDAAETMHSLHRKQTLDFAQAKEWDALIKHYVNLAAAIERGEHKRAASLESSASMAHNHDEPPILMSDNTPFVHQLEMRESNIMSAPAFKRIALSKLTTFDGETM